jgi:hypothetical protein
VKYQPVSRTSARLSSASQVRAAIEASSSRGIRRLERKCGHHESLSAGAARSTARRRLLRDDGGWLKAVHAKTGEVLPFKTPSGIIGNPMTYVGLMASDGRISGVGGWSGTVAGT